MTATATELHPCACGCGEMVKGTWKRGHAARARLLPGPDATDAELDEDLGLIDVPGWVDDEPEDRATGPRPVPDEDDGDEDVRPDPPPRHITSAGGGRQAGPRQRAAKTRVTAGVRRDIEAKLGLMLQIPGRIWQARDPLCGGSFVDAEPEIRSAAVELIVQSPDLVEFFMGAGGGFMLWLNLIVACQPVMFTVWMHHIAHSIETEPGMAQAAPDMTAYAA